MSPEMILGCIYCVFLLTQQIAHGLYIPEVNTSRVRRSWRPQADAGMSEDVFYETYGMGREIFDRLQRKAATLRTIQAQNSGTPVPEEPYLSDVKFDDVIFPEDMVDYLIENAKKHRNANRRRKKRKVRNFDTAPNLKWPNAQVPYVLERHSGAQVSVIRQAIAHWQSETCIRFYELGSSSRPDYVVFTNLLNGCYANYGRTGGAQVINLAPECFGYVGYTIHELGHALGFYHEHSRYDRDSHVRVLWSNILPQQEHNFLSYDRDVITTYGLKYDYASVMHYSAKSFSQNTATLPTLESLELLYQHTMGQRFGLSFLDAKAANIAYCSDACRGSSTTCLRGGYPDPNNCQRCKCPDGFGGTRCDQVASSSDTAQCRVSGVVNVQSTQSACVRVGPYQSGLSCNWLLKASAGCRVRFRFQGDFDVLCSGAGSGPTCRHWVEVKYQGNLETGPRFCCSSRPSFDYLVSDGHEMMVTFRSPQTDGRRFYGFTMCYSIEIAACLETTIYTNPFSSTPLPGATPPPNQNTDTTTWFPPWLTSLSPAHTTSSFNQAASPQTTLPWWLASTSFWSGSNPPFIRTTTNWNSESRSGSSQYSTTTLWTPRQVSTTSYRTTLWWFIIYRN